MKRVWGLVGVFLVFATSAGRAGGERPAVFAVEFEGAKQEKREEAQRKADEKEAKKAMSVNKGLQWVNSRPAGIEFTKSEVTVAQYRACVKAGKCSKPETKSDHKYFNWGYTDRDKHPVNGVDWNQATAFCEWAGGRLPTEDEWYAEASNKGSRKYPWGEERPTCDRVVMCEGGNGCGRDSTWPVCSKGRGNSVSGLCDMSGNLWEWTSSLYKAGKSARVLRGGSWYNDDPDSLRASSRRWNDPTFRNNFFGLRCGRSSR